MLVQANAHSAPASYLVYLPFAKPEGGQAVMTIRSYDTTHCKLR